MTRPMACRPSCRRMPALAAVLALAWLCCVGPAFARDGGSGSGGSDHGGEGSGDDHGGRDGRGQGDDRGERPSEASSRGGAIEFVHPGGWRERVENGRFVMRDPNGRLVIERPAREQDLQRLRKLAR